MVKILFFATDSYNNICDYYDLITEEFLFNIEQTAFSASSMEDIENYNETFDIIVYRSRDRENYYWGYVPSYDDILKCVLKFKPKIIIQLCDEFYYENLQEHNQLANYCNLFLRQFNYFNYEYFANTKQIPLGYYNNFEYRNAIIKPICDRKYSWSFIGCEKSDRKNCIDVFSAIDNEFLHIQKDGISQQISRKDLIDVYLDSIFVLCPRGWSQLECNRIYESILCGAIPVIACNVEEYNETFGNLNTSSFPHWIVGFSWEDAKERCQYFLSQQNELQKMQETNILWWNNLISDIRVEINKVLEK